MFYKYGPADSAKNVKRVLKCARFLFIMIKCRGGIAQLGERLNGIQEVRGSTPLISTKIEISEIRF